MSEAKKNCVRCGKEIDKDGYCPKCVTFTSRTDEGKDKTLSSAKAPKVSAVLINKESDKRHNLNQLVNKIGRDPDNDISLSEDSFVSRYHAWVLYIKDNYWVEDLGSTNGTFLNGIALNERKQVFPGDILKFGRTEYIFELA